MTEYHDHGDEHDHDHDVVPAGADAPDHGGEDAFTGHHPAPLDDLPSHAEAPPELHFPGDEIAAPAGADADPAAPWPDDGDFTRWLADHGSTPATDAPPADDGLSDQLLAAPDDGDALPSSDALVDWTLRRLSENP